MAYSRFAVQVSVRIVALALTIAVLLWVFANTRMYVTIGVILGLAIFEVAALVRFVTRANDEVVRLLDAVAFDDGTQSFSDDVSTRGELARALNRVIGQLRSSRSELDGRVRYLQAVLAHAPVALIAVNSQGRVQLLNPAARRLFGGPIATVADFASHGDEFAAGMSAVNASGGALLRMECGPLTQHLKVAMTDLVILGSKQTIYSLQNISEELSAQEMTAWQTVMRTMAHEVMNSLTPISSLSATARESVDIARGTLSQEHPALPALHDAAEALETVSRRSAGLLHFVQGHRRLTQKLVARTDLLLVRRTFARLQRLLAADLAARRIDFTARVEPEMLEMRADAELLDQALINMIRNAIDAVSCRPTGRIDLHASRGADGRVRIDVSDNGPGVPPGLREKIFVPFFTTKPEGSGIGLTLIRQVAAAHGGSFDLRETPEGGAQFSLLL
ncbi:MAG: ATP-binding protein [Rhizomicrobium sp.]